MLSAHFQNQWIQSLELKYFCFMINIHRSPDQNHFKSGYLMFTLITLSFITGVVVILLLNRYGKE